MKVKRPNHDKKIVSCIDQSPCKTILSSWHTLFLSNGPNNIIIIKLYLYKVNNIIYTLKTCYAYLKCLNVLYLKLVRDILDWTSELRILYLKSDGVEAICVAWWKALRTLYKVHSPTHRDIIIAFSGQVPLLSNLKSRFGKFSKKCWERKNRIVIKLQLLL